MLFQNVSLSIDGKILMEYYASFFAFIRRCLRQLLKKYRLADSIRIWIDYNPQNEMFAERKTK